MILLMVQKSGDHHLSFVVHPIIYDVFFKIQTVVGNGISEPSTDMSNPIASADVFLRRTFVAEQLTQQTSRVPQLDKANFGTKILKG